MRGRVEGRARDAARRSPPCAFVKVRLIAWVLRPHRGLLEMRLAGQGGVQGAEPPLRVP